MIRRQKEFILKFALLSMLFVDFYLFFFGVIYQAAFYPEKHIMVKLFEGRNFLMLLCPALVITTVLWLALSELGSDQIKQKKKKKTKKTQSRQKEQPPKITRLPLT